MISRRNLLALQLVSAFPYTPVWAQDYPSRVIRIVVPTGPGTATDTCARHMAMVLSKQWNSGVIVENKVGAGGNIGTEYVAKASADGYTLLCTYASHYSNPWVYKAGYDPLADFDPIARLASSALVMITSANSPYKSVRDVIAAAKQSPGMISYGSAGNGTTSHMAGALVSAIADIKLNHIPYKTPAQAATDVVGGQVDLSFNGPSTVLPLIKSGRVRALAITTNRRSSYLPDVPTMIEGGLPGYELVSPVWLMAPRGTSSAIVERLSEAVGRATATVEFKQLCATQGVEVDYQNAAVSRANAKAEAEKWRRLVALSAAKAG